MANIARLRALLEQLPTTDEYGTARQIGDVLVRVIEDAERYSALRSHRTYVTYDDAAALPKVEEDRWQPIGLVARQVISRMKRIRDRSV